MAFMTIKPTTAQTTLIHLLTAHALKDSLLRNLTDFVALNIMALGVMS